MGQRCFLRGFFRPEGIVTVLLFRFGQVTGFVVPPYSLRSFPVHRFAALRERQPTLPESMEQDRPPLSLLLPAYNEALRMGDSLDRYHAFLEQHMDSLSCSCDEILIVDDGSDDGTRDLVAEYSCSRRPATTCISLPENQGKGAAIAFGIEYIVSAHSQESTDGDSTLTRLILMTDADGSADLVCLNDMLHEMKRIIAESRNRNNTTCNTTFWDTPALVVGNRGYRGSSVSRTLLRWGFRTAVRVLCGNLGVQDSQCGCKLMTVAAAQLLYRDLYLTQWAHDVEVLYRAREWKVPVGEVTVPWEDKEGSKLVTSIVGAVQASLRMLLDVLRMRVEYATGFRQAVVDDANNKDSKP